MLDHVHDGHPAGPCIVKDFAAGDETRWDAFVEGASEATFFHRAAWRGLIESLGHRCHYLYAERQGAISGILPLGEIRSRLFGHSLISTPFCVYGGIVASDADSKRCLRDAAAALADELRVDYLELRNREPDQQGWPVKDLYVTFHKPLCPNDEGNFKALRDKQRNMIRRGAAAGLTARHDGGIDEFYRVYAESVRNLGTPVLPRNYYAQLKRTFDEEFEISVVSHDGQPIAAAMSFYFRDEVHPYYAGSVWQARQLAGNDFMYWALMQRAVERGARKFDFGRSKVNTGSYQFKKHWGFVPQSLPYAYRLVRAREVPNVSPTNRKYSLFIKAWQKLPLPVADALGPLLARDLG